MTPQILSLWSSGTRGPCDGTRGPHPPGTFPANNHKAASQAALPHRLHRKPPNRRRSMRRRADGFSTLLLPCALPSCSLAAHSCTCSVCGPMAPAGMEGRPTSDRQAHGTAVPREMPKRPSRRAAWGGESLTMQRRLLPSNSNRVLQRCNHSIRRRPRARSRGRMPGAAGRTFCRLQHSSARSWLCHANTSNNQHLAT